MADVMLASREWAERPNDERFWSLEDLRAKVVEEARDSREQTLSVRKIRAKATEDGNIVLAGARYDFALTNWSFRQICQYVQAPPDYLANLPADLIERNMNHGLRGRDEADAKIYVQRMGDDGA